MKHAALLAILFVCLLSGCAGKDNWLSSDSYIMKQPVYLQAEQGNPEAQFKVATYYLRFNDLSNHSRTQGLMWLEKAAAQGYGPAITTKSLMGLPTKVLPKTVVTTSPDGRHTNISKEGSLAVTHELTCISLDEVQTSYTPPDLYVAVKDCIINDQYQQAAELFMLAGTYAYYDKLRVTDTSAHQASSALVLRYIRPLHTEYPEKIKNWSKFMDAQVVENKDVCDKLSSVRKPDYEPVYMATHGLESFQKPYQDLIKTNFDAQANWQEALHKYARCN